MSAAWKEAEKRVAALFGGTRAPILGEESPDVLDGINPVTDFVMIEVKHRATLPAWIKDALAQARKHITGRQLPMAVLHEKGDRGNYLVLSLEEFVEWFGWVWERPCLGDELADVLSAMADALRDGKGGEKAVKSLR